MSVGRPLMIQEDDDRRIEDLKQRIGVRTKVDVVRAGLALLEREAERQARIAGWQRAARASAASSREVNAELRRNTRLRKA
jgi:hypothetical protein